MRQLDFSDGFETDTPPSQGVISTGGFQTYASDAQFVTALTGGGGTLGAGNAYFNSTDGFLHVYNGTIWTVTAITIGSVKFLQVYANDSAYQTALTTAGGTLAAGAEYFNSTDKKIHFYTGTAWASGSTTITPSLIDGAYADDATFAAALAAAGGTLAAGAAYFNTTVKAYRVYDGTVYQEHATLTGVQVITNKDIDGGAAANTRRITIPKDTLANLTALTRKEGTLVYATDAQTLYFDDGTSLIATLGAAVSSVNSFAGVVVLVTDDINEGSTNLYFTDARAKAAAVADAIVDAVTDVAPSQNAVFDALAGKKADFSVLPEAQGGTNQSTYAIGDLLYASAVGTLSKLPIGTAGQVLKTSASLAPEWRDWVNPSEEVRLFDDWIGDGVGDLRWLNASSGTGGASSTGTGATDANHPGIVEPTTGTLTTSSGCGFLGGVTSGAATAGFILGGGQLMFEWLTQVPTLSDGTNTFQTTWGLVDAVTAATAGVFFQYQQGTSVNFLCVTRSASTSTTTDSGIVLNAGQWYKLKAIVNAAGTSVAFYIDGVLIATNTTNIPTATLIAPRFNIIKSAGTTARSMYIDYFKLYQRLTTAR